MEQEALSVERRMPSERGLSLLWTLDTGNRMPLLLEWGLVTGKQWHAAWPGVAARIVCRRCFYSRHSLRAPFPTLPICMPHVGVDIFIFYMHILVCMHATCGACVCDPL